MRLLFLSRWFPYPANNGSKLRIYSLLRRLAQTHQVHLISFIEPGESVDGKDILEKVCQSVELVLRKPYNPSSQRALLGFANLTPRWLVDTYSPEMAEKISRKVSQTHFDLVIASQTDTAIYRKSFGSVPAIFEEAEVGVFYERYRKATSYGRRLRSGLTWAKHVRFLRGLTGQYQACTVVSEQEQRILQQAIHDRAPVVVIPNAVDLEDYAAVSVDPEPGTLIFTGSFQYAPNYAAMAWFTQQVLPQVMGGFPGVRLVITGDPAGRSFPGTLPVEQAGYVEDIRPLVAGAWASLAPIFEGGGTRLKILESMALKTPVVATSKGAEGLNLADGKEILIADTAQEYANSLLSLLENPEKRRSIAQNAYECIRNQYNWAVIMPSFLAICNSIAR